MGVREEHPEVYAEFHPVEVEVLIRHGQVLPTSELDDDELPDGFVVTTGDESLGDTVYATREEAEAMLEKVHAVDWEQARKLAEAEGGA